MAEEGEGGGEDARMELLQHYCLKTTKQVCEEYMLSSCQETVPCVILKGSGPIQGSH